MTTLREARKQEQLEKFIKEHEADPIGDMDKLDAAIKRPSPGTGKLSQTASTPDSRDD